MFTLVFILVMGIIVFTAVSGIVRWSKNNKAPRLSVNAAVVSKRIEISRHNHADAAGNMYMGSDTKYYITFEVESSDRIELKTSGQDYGLIVESDRGKLTFQGTRFISFDRE